MVSYLTSMPNIWKSIFEKSKRPILLLAKHKIVACNQAAIEFFELNSYRDCLDLHPSKLSPEYQPDGQDSFTKAKNMFEKSQILGSYQFHWVHLTANNKLSQVLTTLTNMSTETEDIFFAQIANVTNKTLTLNLTNKLT